MVFNNENKDEKIIINTCNCGCGSELQIKRFVDNDVPRNQQVEYFITLHTSKFDEEQLGIFKIIGRRLKRAWRNLRGKDYVYMEMILNEQEMKEFTEKIQNIQK